MTIRSKSSAASGDHLISISLKQSLDPRADFFVRQTLPAIERGQTFLHGLDKIRVSLEKSIERVLQQLVGAPAVARRELYKAGFLLRCEVQLHETKLTAKRVKSRLRFTLPASQPYADRP